MMRQAVETMTVRTRGRGFYEITRDVQSRVREAGVATGLCTLHLQHTSASLLIQENADPDVRRDFERFFARLVPDGDPLFVHTMEGDDDMPAHVRTALTTRQPEHPDCRGEAVPRHLAGHLRVGAPHLAAHADGRRPPDWRGRRHVARRVTVTRR